MKINDKVYVVDWKGKCKLYEIVGFGKSGMPYVNKYGTNNDFYVETGEITNPNNYLVEDEYRVAK